MKNVLRFSATLLLCTTLGAFGCKKSEPTAAAPPVSGAPPAALPTTPAPPAGDPGAMHAPPAGVDSAGQPARKMSGKIVEKIDAASYSYLRFTTSAGETWAAVPTAQAKVGDEVTVLVQMDMNGFESKSLNRKFDRLVFGTLEGQTPGPAAGNVPNPHAGVPGAPGGPGAALPPGQVPAGHPAAAPTPADVGDVKVPKAAGADARTVAEVYSQKATLKDKPVAIRGKVVKYMANVMGKNWLHLRDGSGTEAGKDNDITVTSPDTAAVGDVITVRGPVHLDRDFGAGYSYGVIVEDAKIEKSSAN